MAAGYVTCGTTFIAMEYHRFLFAAKIINFERGINMEHLRKKNEVAVLSVLSNVLLIIIKIIVGILSGSVSIISEAIHSLVDLAASFIALCSINLASKPADRDHPYGHGKIENVSGVIEGIMIFIAVILIIRESIEKIIKPSPIEQAYLAIGVMAVSALVNFVVAKAIYKVVKKTGSVALEADAVHHLTDTYTSLGVMAGLILINVTGIHILDPIVAMGVALFILREAWLITKTAFGPLLDQSLSEQQLSDISVVLNATQNKTESILGYNNLKTRKSGHLNYIEMVLIVLDDISLIEAHAISDMIENEIEALICNTCVTIHIEPVGHQSCIESEQNYHEYISK